MWVWVCLCIRIVQISVPPLYVSPSTLCVSILFVYFFFIPFDFPPLLSSLYFSDTNAQMQMCQLGFILVTLKNASLWYFITKIFWNPWWLGTPHTLLRYWYLKISELNPFLSGIFFIGVMINELFSLGLFSFCQAQLSPSCQLQPQLPAAAKLAELQPYFAFHPPPPPPRASRF